MAAQHRHGGKESRGSCTDSTERHACLSSELSFSAATTMAAKRKNEDKETNAINVARAGSSTQRKKVRLDEARKISVQTGTPSAQGMHTSSSELSH